MALPEVNSERWLNPERLAHEEWRKVDILPGVFKVSNKGRVRVKLGVGRYKILYATNNGRDYFTIPYLHKKFYIHRLVGMAFVRNPNNYPEIDHINGNKRDNRPCNLRWVTRQMNMHNSVTVERRQPYYRSLEKSIAQISVEGDIIQVWGSIKEASRATRISKNILANVSSVGGKIGPYFYERIAKQLCLFD